MVPMFTPKLAARFKPRSMSDELLWSLYAPNVSSFAASSSVPPSPAAFRSGSTANPVAAPAAVSCAVARQAASDEYAVPPQRTDHVAPADQ